MTRAYFDTLPPVFEGIQGPLLNRHLEGMDNTNGQGYLRVAVKG